MYTDSSRLNNLNVADLKKIVKEVVSEELMKRQLATPPTYTQPYCPCQPSYSPYQTVWATASTEAAPLKHPTIDTKTHRIEREI